jgi:hypothetical protein
MKRYDLVMGVSIALLMIASFAGCVNSEIIRLKHENGRLKGILLEKDKQIETLDVEGELMEKEAGMREGEISYWGRLYDYMKQHHPETAKEAEKQINYQDGYEND